MRTAIFKPANELVGMLLQQAADRIDATYTPKPGEQPKGREVLMIKGMLGCAFTQLKKDDQGRPVRDHDSTTCLTGFQSPSDFGVGLRREAIRRGFFSAQETVLLIDGASGLEKLGHDYFPGAVQIVDFYHALEHLQTLIETLWGKGDEARNKRRRHYWKKLLAHDGVERIIKQARKEALLRGNVAEVETALGYFANNVSRMQYGTFRAKKYFIGSGVVEAGCRSLIGKRCKQSGMFWGEPGADKVLAFRCIHASRRMDSFWKYRLNSRAAENDTLPLAA